MGYSSGMFGMGGMPGMLSGTSKSLMDAELRVSTLISLLIVVISSLFYG